MDYTQFTTEALVLDTYFQRWVNRQLPPEDNFWEEWLSLHPEKAGEVSQAKFVLKALEMDRVAPDDRLMAGQIERILNSLDEKPILRRRLFFPMWWRVAAMLVLVGGIGWYVFQDAEKADTYVYSAKSSILQPVQKINNSDQPIKLSLSDGSLITLQPKSSLSYPEAFSDDKREVFLVGEARFAVTKDPLRPFLVHSNELVTKVLGTVFSIRAFENDRDITVKVYEGKVSVLAGKEKMQNAGSPFNQNEGVILTPNQMAVFDRKPERLIKTLVENPVIIHPPGDKSDGTGNFVFDNTPVNRVFEILEKSYGVTIVYDRDMLNGCTVTAPLGNETLYEKLDLVCKVIRASYEVVDAQVIVSSKGCM